MAWKWYTTLDADPQNNVEFSGIKQLVHLSDLSDNPQDFVLWYAEVEEDTGDNGTLVQQAYSNPGTDPINASIVDEAPSSGHAADEVTLALNAADLDTNTAGASLTISSVDSDYGECVFSGYSNAVEVHVRVENAVTAVSDSTELRLHIVDIVDSAVSSGS